EEARPYCACLFKRLSFDQHTGNTGDSTFEEAINPVVSISYHPAALVLNQLQDTGSQRHGESENFVHRSSGFSLHVYGREPRDPEVRIRRARRKSILDLIVA